MNDFGLSIKRMPSSAIIKGFVKGAQNSNYEIYLLELLNNSDFFSNLGKSLFHAPASEESGQCDAIANAYEIDFKLLASQTELMAASVLVEQPHVLSEGVVFYTESKIPNGNITVTKIHAALRGLSLKDLEAIRLTKTGRTSICNDIPEVLETVETPKNILLLFPYIFSFVNPPERLEAIETIRAAMGSDLRNLILYREMKCPQFDTFFTVVYEDEFLIFRGQEGELQFVEAVPITKMPTFSNLSSYGDILS